MATMNKHKRRHFNKLLRVKLLNDLRRIEEDFGSAKVTMDSMTEYQRRINNIEYGFLEGIRYARDPKNKDNYFKDKVESLKKDCESWRKGCIGVSKELDYSLKKIKEIYSLVGSYIFLFEQLHKENKEYIIIKSYFTSLLNEIKLFYPEIEFKKGVEKE